MGEVPDRFIELACLITDSFIIVELSSEDNTSTLGRAFNLRGAVDLRIQGSMMSGGAKWLEREVR